MSIYLALARVEFDYAAQTEEELTVAEDQLVWIIEDDDAESVFTRTPPAAMALSPPPLLALRCAVLTESTTTGGSRSSSRKQTPTAQLDSFPLPTSPHPRPSAPSPPSTPTSPPATTMVNSTTRRRFKSTKGNRSCCSKMMEIGFSSRGRTTRALASFLLPTSTSVPSHRQSTTPC